jgi:hypothetical protein
MNRNTSPGGEGRGQSVSGPRMGCSLVTTGTPCRIVRWRKLSGTRLLERPRCLLLLLLLLLLPSDSNRLRRAKLEYCFIYYSCVGVGASEVRDLLTI